MKFQEGDYVIVGGDVHRISKMLESLPPYPSLVQTEVRGSLEIWLGNVAELAAMQVGHWRQTERMRAVRVNVPGGYYAKGVWCANTKMMPQWEHVVA